MAKQVTTICNIYQIISLPLYEICNQNKRYNLRQSQQVS